MYIQFRYHCRAQQNFTNSCIETSNISYDEKEINHPILNITEL